MQIHSIKERQEVKKVRVKAMLFLRIRLHTVPRILQIILTMLSRYFKIIFKSLFICSR